MTLDSTMLSIAKPPWILWLTTRIDDSRFTEQLLAEHGITARVLRGKRMRTKHDLFEEVALHLSFPDYFGRNLGRFSRVSRGSRMAPGSYLCGGHRWSK